MLSFCLLPYATEDLEMDPRPDSEVLSTISSISAW